MNPLPSRRLLRGIAAALAVTVSTAGLVHAAPPAGAPAHNGNGGGRQGGQGQGQGQADGRGRMMQVFEDYRTLITSLDLDKDQSKQVRDIMQETRESMRSAAQDAQTMSPQDRLTTFKEALDTLDGKIDAVLSPDQKTKFDAGTADIRTRAADSMRPGGRAGRDGATTGPSTRPGGGGGPGGGQGGGPGGGAPGGRMMERVQRAMDDAALSDDQKEKMKPLLDDAREKITQIIADARASGNADPQAIRGQVRDIFADVLKKSGDFLSADQVDKLKTALQQRPGGPNGGGGGGNGNGGNGNGGNGGQPKGDGTPPPPPPPATQPPADKPDKPAAAAPAAPSNIAMIPNEAGNNAGLAASTTFRQTSSPTTQPSLSVGDPLPAFSLTKLDGRIASNKSFTARPAVILFGSYTSPPFRDHMALIQQLSKKYSTRVAWLVIYTREMHPANADEPERNRDDHISIAEHKTTAERLAAAKKAKDELQITLDMAPDTLDDAFTDACSGFPDAAIILGADGKVAAREEWADAFGLERALDRELKKK